jgi:hypothetical protein
LPVCNGLRCQMTMAHNTHIHTHPSLPPSLSLCLSSPQRASTCLLLKTHNGSGRPRRGPGFEVEVSVRRGRQLLRRLRSGVHRGRVCARANEEGGLCRAHHTPCTTTKKEREQGTSHHGDIMHDDSMIGQLNGSTMISWRGQCSCAPLPLLLPHPTRPTSLDPSPPWNAKCKQFRLTAPQRIGPSRFVATQIRNVSSSISSGGGGDDGGSGGGSSNDNNNAPSSSTGGGRRCAAGCCAWNRPR